MEVFLCVFSGGRSPKHGVPSPNAKNGSAARERSPISLTRRRFLVGLAWFLDLWKQRLFSRAL
jgi:hypothetical protein